MSKARENFSFDIIFHSGSQVSLQVPHEVKSSRFQSTLDIMLLSVPFKSIFDETSNFFIRGVWKINCKLIMT